MLGPLRLIAAACLLLVVGRSDASPNVVVVLTDDQGWGDLSLHEAPGLQTPNLDRLGRSGARFDRFYVSPVCAPTRASFLSGRYHWRTGVFGVTRGREHMRAKEQTIAEVFGDVGYATGCFGKWHNGAAYPLDPIGQGFGEFVGFCAGHWNNYFDTHLRNAKRLPDGSVEQREIGTDGFIIDVLTDRAIGFIERAAARSEPFLCYIPLNTPHTPPQMPDRYWRRFADRTDLDEKTKSAYALVENIDDNVGRLLAALTRLGLDEDTIVVFFTDNGANSNRWDGDMRGTKGSVHEGGIRVPCFVRWTGTIPEGDVVDAIGQHCDLLPTLASLCGIELDSPQPLDGIDLSPHLLPANAGLRVSLQSPKRTLITTHGPRDGRVDSSRRSLLETETMLRATFEGRDGWKLWDIRADPSQTTNIAADRPEDLTRLTARWDEYAAEFDRFEPIPIPVGHSERPEVTLQGHEAFLRGAGGTEGDAAAGEGVSYHGRSGWANDYIDNWTSTDAYPYWEIDAFAGGEYAAEVSYRLHPADAGFTLTLQSDAGETTASLTDALDQAPLDSPDRFERGETYEHRWLTRSLGTLPIAEGRQRLRLRLDGFDGAAGPKVINLRLRKVTGIGSP